MKKLLLSLTIFSFLTSSGQGGSELFLFDIAFKDGRLILTNGKNITNHKGYDNQPFFHPSKPVIYYSSFNDSGRSDIKYFDYKKNKTRNLTLTNEREYSPTLTPDGKYISCIIQRDNGAQDLGKYPVSGGKSRVFINNLTVGYHAWGDKDKLLLFVLGDSNRHSLHYYNLATREDTVITTNIGRSLHKIPGQAVMSFIQKVTDKEAVIKKIDLATGAVSDIVAAIPGIDHIAWLNRQVLVSTDGTNIYTYRTGGEGGWTRAIIEGDATMLKGVTRLAANTDGNKLAVVVSE